MVTMTRQRKLGSRSANPGLKRRRVMAGAAPRAVVAVTLIACASAAGPARAERWVVDADVGTQLTRTSNARLDSTEIADTVAELKARVALRGEGPRLKVVGSAAVSAVGYQDHTVAKQILPEADLNARLEAIDRFFFVEAGYRATQTAANAFGARPDSSSAIANSRTTSQWRLSPSVESSLGANSRYRIRSDNTWSHEVATESAVQVANAGGYFGRHSAIIERDPVPLGFRIEAERSQTRYTNSTLGALTSDLARVGLRYLIGPDLTFGLRAGAERDDFLTKGSNSTYGLEAQWQPSPRTTLTTSRDHRYFGSKWEAKLLHRQPRFALNAVLSRDLNTTPQALFELPATNDVAALLNAMLTTRFPDPIQRLQVAQELIARQGLPGSTLAPIILYAQRLSIVTSRRMDLAYMTGRTTFGIGVFSVQTRDAADSAPLATGNAVTNNTQHGASFALGHRLSPTIALSSGIDWSSIRALESLSPDRTIQRAARLEAKLQLGTRTSAHVGARYRRFGSNVASDSNERAAFVGADHRF